MGGAAVAIVQPDSALVFFETAKHALAQARKADEVKGILAQAEGIKAAARVAGDRQMETDAAEIRIRAVRRLGEMLREQKEAIGFHRGGRPTETTSNSEAVLPTLREMGIDDKMSAQSQRLAEVPEDRFEDKILHWRRKCEDGKSRITLTLWHGEDAPPGVHAPKRGIGKPTLGEIANRPQNYEEEMGFFIERRHELGLSQADLDDQIKWSDTQTSKYEIPHDPENGRIHGARSRFDHIGGLELDVWYFPKGMKVGPIE